MADDSQHGVLSDAIENIQGQTQRLLMLLMDNQKRIDGMERDLSMSRVSLETLSRRMPNVEEGTGRSHTGTTRNQSQKSSGPRYWTPAEHTRFVEALDKYGRKDVKSIAKHVESRNATQVRTHAQKYFLRMKKDDPEQYARFCEDDPEDGVPGGGPPQKRKADQMMMQQPQQSYTLQTPMGNMQAPAYQVVPQVRTGTPQATMGIPGQQTMTVIPQQNMAKFVSPQPQQNIVMAPTTAAPTQPKYM